MPVFVAQAVNSRRLGDDMRDVFTGGFDVVQVFFAVRSRTDFDLQQQFGKADDGRQRVVDVVCNAAGHLAERLEPLLLHDGLLGLVQFVVSGLQILIKLGLPDRQRDVRA